MVVLKTILEPGHLRGKVPKRIWQVHGSLVKRSATLKRSTAERQAPRIDFNSRRGRHRPGDRRKIEYSASTRPEQSVRLPDPTRRRRYWLGAGRVNRHAAPRRTITRDRVFLVGGRVSALSFSRRRSGRRWPRHDESCPIPWCRSRPDL